MLILYNWLLILIYIDLLIVYNWYIVYVFYYLHYIMKLHEAFNKIEVFTTK